jgi:hypothetical protein
MTFLLIIWDNINGSIIMTAFLKKYLLNPLFQREGWFGRLTLAFVILSLPKDVSEEAE